MVTAAKVDLWNRALLRIGETEFLQSDTDDVVAARVLEKVYDDLVLEALEATPWPWARKESPLTSIGSQSVTYSYNASVSLTDFEIAFSYISSANQVAVYRGTTLLVAGTDYAVQDADPETGALARIILTSALTIGQTVTITVTVERVGWEFIYSLPADCITPVALLDEEGDRVSLIQPNAGIAYELQANDNGTAKILLTNEELDDDFVLQYVAAITYVPMFPRAFVEALVCLLASELASGLKKDNQLADYHRRRFQIAVSQTLANSDRAGTDGADQPETPSIAVRR